jgi:hypothetical protein
LGQQIYALMQKAARWAGINVGPGEKFTVGIIKAILEKMLSTLRSMATVALSAVTHHIRPEALGLSGGWVIVDGQDL